ncbi:hypothetical protein AB5I41_18005 [Sphingomonas sp. MMS24-JH45]
MNNFIGTTQVDQSAFGLRNPAAGPRYRQAVAALGTTDNILVRDYILRNFPGSSTVTGNIEVPQPNGTTINYLNGNILALPEDDLFNFQISQPFNSDQTANIDGWEFAVQHRLWDTGFGVILNYTDRQRRREIRQCARSRRRPVRAGGAQRQRRCGRLLRQERHPGPRRLQLARRILRRRGVRPDLCRGLWAGRRQRELGVPQGSDRLRGGDQHPGRGTWPSPQRQFRDLRPARLRPLHGRPPGQLLTERGCRMDDRHPSLLLVIPAQAADPCLYRWHTRRTCASSG